MEKFQAFLEHFYNSRIASTPMKLIENQPWYFDVEMKQKTFYHKDRSYNTPVFKISLKIPGGYIEELKEIPRFSGISDEIENLKQKARENNVQIQVNKDGGVEFYRKLYHPDLLKKITPEEVIKLDEWSIQKKYLENQIKRGSKLHPEARKHLKSEFVKKFKQVNAILQKIAKPKPDGKTKKPYLRIVK